jgi:formylglycine-generating enzyme required for sulfatase activity
VALAGGLLLLGLGGVYLYHEVRHDDEPRPAPATAETDRPVQGIRPSSGQAVEVPDMVRLPAGRFLMGSPAQEPKRDEDEGPQHQVQVAAFELGKTEVTRGQFRSFMEATGYHTEAEQGDGCYGWKDGSWTQDKSFNWRNVGFVQGDDSPVVCVSWNDAQRYIGWLSQETG